MKRLVLVRHGETTWHGENRYAGHSDIPLSSDGFAQATQLALWASTARLHAIWSSPLLRARDTAQPAAASTGLPLSIDDRLIELDFGRGEGMTAAEMKAEFPVEREAFLRDPVAHHLPGGEDPHRAADRAAAALRDIVAILPENARALVVGHNTLLRLLLCRLLDIPLARYRSTFPELNNVSRTELGFGSGRTALLSFNAPLIVPETGQYVHV
jgi:broad specificity phosphatase PhoE